MTDRTATDSKLIPKAAPKPGHDCCGSNTTTDTASKSAHPSAPGHTKAIETCCGGTANK